MAATGPAITIPLPQYTLSVAFGLVYRRIVAYSVNAIP